MIFLLVIVSAVYIFISTKIANNILASPTFISGLTVFVGSIIYVVQLNRISNDISIQTVLLFFGAFFFVFLGEATGRVIIPFHISTHKNNLDLQYMFVSSFSTIVSFFFLIITAALRFNDMRLFTSGSWNIIEIIARMRPYVTNGMYDVPTYILYMTRIGEIICFIYEYIFVYNLVNHKKADKLYFLPIFGYFLVVLTFTSRTDFLKIFVGFLASYVFCIYRKGTVVKIASKKMVKLLAGAVLLAVAFFAFGYVRASNGENEIYDFNIFNSIFKYSGAAIYGLDAQLSSNTYIEDAKYIGYWTCQRIYDFFRIKRNMIPVYHLPPYTYAPGQVSNIYTSLVLPLKDFGLIGLLISRYLISLAMVWILRVVKNVRNHSLINFMCIFLFINLYCSFLFFSLADKFKDVFLDPNALLRYTLVTYIVAKYILRIKYKKRIEKAETVYDI